MSSYENMSLDDIIKMKREEARAQRSNEYGQSFKPSHEMASTKDARYKNKSKTKTRIADAREKLTHISKQRDVRFKVQKAAVPETPSINIPNISIATWAPPSNTMSYQQIQTPEPFNNPEDEYVPETLAEIRRKRSLQLQNQTFTKNTGGCDTFVSSIYRTVGAEKDKAPLRPQTPPMPPPGKLTMDPLMSAVISQTNVGYKVRVTNLSYAATDADIEQLFGEVGPMLESRVVHPGTAQVIYEKLEHALTAVQAFDTKPLDGQHMHCVFDISGSPSANYLCATPSSPATSSFFVTTRSSDIPEVSSTITDVEPDVDAVRDALFNSS